MVVIDIQKYQETSKRLKMPYQMLAIMKQRCTFHYQFLISTSWAFCYFIDYKLFNKLLILKAKTNVLNLNKVSCIIQRY